MKRATIILLNGFLHVRVRDCMLYGCKYGKLYSEDLQPYLYHSTMTGYMMVKASVWPILMQAAHAEGITLTIKPY